MRLDIDELRAWTGRQEVTEDVVTPFPVAALAATLDRDDPPPAPGTPLPPLWHWLYFLPLHRQSEIGPDGHAKRGGFLPPVPLPRRMWAGGRFEFRRPLRVGDAVRRTSTIADVSLKEGRTGPLAFVLVRHEVATGEGGVARRVGGKRGERRVGVVERVPELPDDAQSRAVAPRRRHREPARRDHHRGRVERLLAFGEHLPGTLAYRGAEPHHRRVDHGPHSAAAGQRQQPVAHVAGAVGFREELARLRLQHQPEPHVVLEEAPLVLERPGQQDLAKRVGRRVGDVAGGIHLRGQHVAAAAAADQDLAPAVPRPLQQDHARAALRRKEGGEHPGRPRADHHHRQSLVPFRSEPIGHSPLPLFSMGRLPPRTRGREQKSDCERNS